MRERPLNHGRPPAAAYGSPALVDPKLPPNRADSWSQSSHLSGRHLEGAVHAERFAQVIRDDIAGWGRSSSRARRPT